MSEQEIFDFRAAQTTRQVNEVTNKAHEFISREVKVLAASEDCWLVMARVINLLYWKQFTLSYDAGSRALEKAIEDKQP